MATTLERASIDQFIDLFLAALVMRGKTSIWVKRERAHEECRRMHALYKFMNSVVDDLPKDTDKDRLYFLVRLRNHLAPSNIGSFDDLLGSILHKMSTIISIDLAWCESYQIDLHRVTAKCWLEQADPELRKLAEDAADAYMAPLRETA